ncbi:MAG: UvrD-helicase domain-containing protein [Acidobacteriia bacterium]|nr:UvrD-helicase domain-containing protein [Terriglobia bacterium]
MSLKLNPAQQKAVENGEGPLLIIAGPGSGKTRVITQRIVHLLENVPGLGPGNLLALTFTDKAAEEMKERVRDALPGLDTTPHISTFHSFCYQILRTRHFERILLDKVDVWIFLRRRMEQLELEFYQKLAEPGAFLHALNDFFSRCQDELIEPVDFERYVRELESQLQARAPGLDPDELKLLEEEIQKKKEIARVFRNSRRLIEEAGCSSLGSLIPETVRLFDREPQIAERYRARFRYVLVDEFQDTNYGQVELLKRVVQPPFNITAVGDDDQAIYRFRGASHGAFEMFDAAFPNHAIVYLDRNYRSTRRILRVADVVINRNDRYKQKPDLQTEKEEGERIFLLESTDYLSEAHWIAGEVARLAKSGIPFGDIAVLYRAHNYRDPLVEEFRRRKIPFAIRGLSILSTIVLRDLLAYLNVVHSPHDNVSLTRVLLMPRWRFQEELALEVRREAGRNRCSLYDVLESWEKAVTGSRLAGTAWQELKVLLAGLRKFSERAPMTALLDRLLEQLGVAFLPDDPDEYYVRAFRKFLEEWEAKSETRRLAEFMEYFQYFLEAGGTIAAPEPERAAQAVQMMTVHAAKGLEFPVVFILSVAPRRFPHSEQKPVIQFPDELRRGPQPPRDIHLQEERRLFYVGLTRAKERLYISSVSKSSKKLSQFIEDAVADPAIAARDIERIQVPELRVEPEPAAPARPPSRAARSNPQGNLFAAPAESGSLHPDISGWASRPPDIPADEKLPLSASAIETYEECPLKFKFSHYLRIPTGPQAALTFGNLMHQCVRVYFDLRARGKIRWEDLEAFYERAWRSAGFEDAYQEKVYRKAGLEQLRAFVRKQESNPTTPLDMETHFALDLGDVVLEGRIDQINPLQDRAIELVDYKTGRPKSQKEADQSLQLSVYALAAREQLRLNPARLTFYSLANNETVFTVRTPKDLDAVRDEIRAVAEKIRQKLFPPTPGFVCKYCDYVMICPAHEEEF